MSTRPSCYSSIPAVSGRWSVLRSVGPFCMGALLPCLAACPSPDPEAKLDRFIDHTEEEREEFQGQKMDVGGALADITGTFHFALSSVIAPDFPLQFVVTSTFTPNDDGTGGTLNLEFQPLSLEVGSTTEPREFVGDVLPLMNLEVGAGGGFEVDLGTVMVTGEANPITGSDIVSNLVLMGGIQSADLWCGTVSGEVTSPIMQDLAGSTFAAQRIEMTDPASLPGAEGQAELLDACPAGGGGGTGGDTDTDTGDATGTGG